MKSYQEFLNENDDFLNEVNLSRSLSKKEIEQRKELLKKNLQEFLAICKKHKVRHWIDGGTLLGLYRDKDFIEGDSDSDVGIMAEDITPEFLDDLGKHTATVFEPRSFYATEELKKNLEKDEFVPIKSMKYFALNGSDKPLKVYDYIWADVYIYYPLNDKERFFYCAGWYYKIPEKFIGKSKSMSRDGFSYSIPEKTEDYLAHLYGEGWVEPDPTYRSYADPDRSNFAVKGKDFEKDGKFLWNWKSNTSKREKK